MDEHCFNAHTQKKNKNNIINQYHGAQLDELLEKGIRRLEWAKAHMAVLKDVRERLVKERPLKG